MEITLDQRLSQMITGSDIDARHIFQMMLGKLTPEQSTRLRQVFNDLSVALCFTTSGLNWCPL
jgi:hypothetical protein